jgi:hypothetical protein
MPFKKEKKRKEKSPVGTSFTVSFSPKKKQKQRSVAAGAHF